ncbi:MAG: hypothetical protein JSR77_04210 [Planctomycetes bacterium]|nr:hypothetical protein [Planctomycetota bacterium]
MKQWKVQGTRPDGTPLTRIIEAATPDQAQTIAAESGLQSQTVCEAPASRVWFVMGLICLGFALMARWATAAFSRGEHQSAMLVSVVVGCAASVAAIYLAHKSSSGRSTFGAVAVWLVVLLGGLNCSFACLELLMRFGS